MVDETPRLLESRKGLRLRSRRAWSQLAHGTLGRLGLEYRRPQRMAGGRSVPYRFKIRAQVPHWLAREVALVGRWCTVDIDAIIAPPAFSFAADGWHPYSVTLAEFGRNPELSPTETTLARVYRNFLPQNAHEALFASDSPAPEILHRLPARLAGHEWMVRADEVRLALLGQPPVWMLEGHRVFGPVSAEYVQDDFRRLISVYNSIRRHGHLPEISSDPISGYFLVYSGNFRFRLTAGQHRIAALRAIGYRSVRARLALPISVSSEFVGHRAVTLGWATSAGEANRLFDQQLREKGWGVAERWSLVDGSDSG